LNRAGQGKKNKTGEKLGGNFKRETLATQKPKGLSGGVADVKEEGQESEDFRNYAKQHQQDFLAKVSRPSPAGGEG